MMSGGEQNQNKSDHVDMFVVSLNLQDSLDGHARLNTS